MATPAALGPADLAAAFCSEAVALYETDEFRIWSFKVLPCSNRMKHVWQECPFAHPGEHAARRDPCTHAYSSRLCPDMLRAKACPRGDACGMAHSLWEAYLHPARYRMMLCREGPSCTRTVCFFAHSEVELRHPAPTDHGYSHPCCHSRSAGGHCGPPWRGATPGIGCLDSLPKAALLGVGDLEQLLSGLQQLVKLNRQHEAQAAAAQAPASEQLPALAAPAPVPVPITEAALCPALPPLCLVISGPACPF